MALGLKNRWKELPVIVKHCIVIGAAFLVVIVAAYFLYTELRDARADIKINAIEHEQIDIKAATEMQHQKFKAAETDFLDKQEAHVKNAKQIQKNNRYETPKISIPAYDVMRDSLSSAMPD